MGWWDCGIMGGDTPLDYRDSIHKMLGLEFGLKLSGQLPDSKLREIIRHAESDGWLEDEPWIFWEVLAFIIMEAGAAMPDDIQASAISAVGDELASGAIENWKKPDERRARLREFQQAVKAYDGTPIRLNEVGLLERIASLLDGEELGVTRMFAQVFHSGYMRATPTVRGVIEEMVALVMEPDLDEQERNMALTTLADALGLLGGPGGPQSPAARRDGR